MKKLLLLVLLVIAWPRLSKGEVDSIKVRPLRNVNLSILGALGLRFRWKGYTKLALMRFWALSWEWGITKNLTYALPLPAVSLIGFSRFHIM